MTTPPRVGHPSTGHDRGAATVWMVFATIIVMAVAGLVYDGGALIATKRNAINHAEEAARAGAQEIDIDAVMTGTGVHLDPQRAAARAQAFLATNGWEGTVSADPSAVTVTITIRHEPAFLQLLGIGRRTVTGTATASPRHDLAGS